MTRDFYSDLPYTVGTVIQKVINEIEIGDGEGIIHNAEGVDILPGNHSLRAVEQQLDEVYRSGVRRVSQHGSIPRQYPDQ